MLLLGFIANDWLKNVVSLAIWLATQWVAGDAAKAVAEDRSATPQEVANVIGLFENAIRQDPDGSRSSPPMPISVARAVFCIMDSPI